MDPTDHYAVLGLPSGEEGARLSEKDIAKAYRMKALELHPDKRPDDPNAQANFQKLKASYEILRDEKARKLFDDLVRAKREQRKRRYMYGENNHDAKRSKKMSHLEEMESRYASERMRAQQEKEEEERTIKKLQEEIAEIRAKHKKKLEEESAQKVHMHANKRRRSAAPPHFREKTEDGPWKDPARFQVYEDEVLRKMRMAAQRQKMARGHGNSNNH